MNSFRRLTSAREFCTLASGLGSLKIACVSGVERLTWQLRSFSPRLDWLTPVRCDYLNTSHQVPVCIISHKMKTDCNVAWLNETLVTILSPYAQYSTLNKSVYPNHDKRSSGGHTAITNRRSYEQCHNNNILKRNEIAIRQKPFLERFLYVRVNVI